MRPPHLESRQGAALVLAVVVVLTILALVAFFLQQSLIYSARATDERVRAQSLAAADIGLALAYQRLRSGVPLDQQQDDFLTEGGRVWTCGEISGRLDKKDGSDTGAYRVQVDFSDLKKIAGRADGGSDHRLLVDADLQTVDRPETWFPGKTFMMLTGDLAGIELRILSFDPLTGSLEFEPQLYPVAPGDLYEIPAGIEYRFVSDGTYINTTRTVETWWWRQSRPLKKYTQRGAVVANGKVQVLGNIEIDGRDHCANGGKGMPSPEQCSSLDQHHILEAGVKGISSTGVTIQDGSSGIGGDGQAPESQPAGLSYVEQYPDPTMIDNGIDDDGDGATDEDPYNGVDDDRDAAGAIVQDGKREEDLRFPRNPDEAMGLDKGTLREIARQSGTLFTRQADFEAYLISHGEVLPGGLVYYLEIPVLDMGKIEMDMSGSDDPQDDPPELKPIVFAVHYEDASGNPIGEIRNMHLIAKGLVMTDVLNKVNGGTRIIGGMQSFSEGEKANIYGNGNAKIWYSSIVLANLPNNARGAVWNSTAWRELP